MSVPDKLVIRTGGSNWRDYVPLLVADTTTNFQYWNPDSQYNDVNVAPDNEIAKQFSYFAAYWLNRNKVAVNGTLNVSVSSGGTFYFQALNSNPVTSYQGLYAPVNESYVTLTLQQDGVDAGISYITLSSTIGYNIELSYGTYTVDLPLGRDIKVQLFGAGGGNSKGGTGGYVEGVVQMSKISSKKIYIVVGTAGGTTAHSSSNSGGGYYVPGGTNGGGRGIDNSASSSSSGGGGGAVDVRLDLTSYSQRILVAGGGGGGTNNGGSDTTGGNGGYPNAPNVADSGYGGADGGTQSSGGSLGGGLGIGGENATNTGWNGGGGGGYYGGGACKVQHGAGAGGSGYYDPTYITSFTYTASGGGSSARTNGRAILTVVSGQVTATPTLGDFNDSKTFGTGSFNVIQPSSPSTGAFTYSITSGTDVISVSGTTITILQAGSATIQASQAASGSYLAATKTATINITPATPTLGDFNDSRTFGTGSFNVIQPSSPSTGAFTYSITSGTDVISISGTTITILKAGSATIQAFQTASTNYVAVTKNATININRAAGTLSVTKSIFYQKFVSGASVPFDVISSNAGTVSRTHESNNTSIVSIPSSSSPAATIVGPGKTTIKVTQPQQTSYEQIIEYSLVTIVIIGSGLTYSSENMTSLDLTGTNLSGSVFSSCILTSANLFGATVNASTNLSSATLTNVRSGRIIGTTSLLPSGFKMI